MPEVAPLTRAVISAEYVRFQTGRLISYSVHLQMTCEHLIKCGVNPDWIEDHIGQVDRALEGRVGDGVPFLIENKHINLEDLKIDIDAW